MNEPPQTPPPRDDEPQAADPQTSGPHSGGEPAPDASAGTPERPPPYQGTYGAQPGQAPPPPGHGPPVQPGYGPPGHGHPGPRYGYADPRDVLAGRWARLGGAILDSLILACVAAPAALFSIRWDKMEESVESGEPVTNPLDLYNVPRLVVSYTIVFLLGWAYYTVLHAKWGQTIGKKAVGIRLVRAADQSAVSWGQAFGRQAFVYAISIVTVVVNFQTPAGAVIGLLGLLDTAWILWDPRRQAVHDKVAGTLVVKAAPWLPNPYARS